MGQKCHPKALRLGINQEWDCNWFSKLNYADYLSTDLIIRKFLNNEFQKAGVSRVVVNRKSDFLQAIVFVSRTGVVFGRNAMDISLISSDLSKRIGQKISILVKEQTNPDCCSKLISKWICFQLEKRVPFRRAMKMSIQKVLKSGGQGIKIMCSGRLGGIEIARTETYKEGKIPLHTLRANIDYSLSEAHTTYGIIGVKVWIYKGEKLSLNRSLNSVEEKVNVNS